MDVLPVGKNANPLWKAAIWLAAAAAVASFMISAKPTREFGDWHVLSGVVAVLLNPLCWIGLWGGCLGRTVFSAHIAETGRIGSFSHARQSLTQGWAIL